METPTPSTASETLLSLGRFHLAAIRQSPKTEGLAPGFEATQNELKEAHAARLAAEEALVEPRVALRFSEYRLEDTIREAALFAHAKDGSMAGGPVFNAVFVNGLDAEIRPRGAAQSKAASNVTERIKTQPAAEPLRETHLPSILGALTDFEAKVAARKTAGEALGKARAREDGARETWVAAYDSDAGAIRALFPRRRREQDLYFDVFRTRRGRNADEDSGEEEPTPSPATT